MLETDSLGREGLKGERGLLFLQTEQKRKELSTTFGANLSQKRRESRTLTLIKLAFKFCTATSHGVLAGPFSGGGLVLGSVSLVDVSNLRHEGIVRVGVGQEGAD